MKRITRAIACLTALALSAAGAVRADDPIATRAVAVSWLGRVPQLSFSVPDFITASVADKLGSGLPQRILTRIYAYVEGAEQPIAVSVQSCRVVYDLWEGVYRVQSQTDAIDRSLTAPDLAGVVRTCLEVHALTIGDGDTFARYRARRVYFAALIELNPLSPDTVQRIRRWLSKSGGGQLSGEAFFGSFVSIFVSRRMGSAEYSLAFRSASASVPP